MLLSGSCQLFLHLCTGTSRRIFLCSSSLEILCMCNCPGWLDICFCLIRSHHTIIRGSNPLREKNIFDHCLSIYVPLQLIFCMVINGLAWEDLAPEPAPLSASASESSTMIASPHCVLLSEHTYCHPSPLAETVRPNYVFALCLAYLEA
jgi:hypothetical protein